MLQNITSFILCSSLFIDIFFSKTIQWYNYFTKKSVLIIINVLNIQNVNVSQTKSNFFQLDLQLQDENGGDISGFTTNGEWDLLGKQTRILLFWNIIFVYRLTCVYCNNLLTYILYIIFRTICIFWEKTNLI